MKRKKESILNHLTHIQFNSMYSSMFRLLFVKVLIHIYFYFFSLTILSAILSFCDFLGFYFFFFFSFSLRPIKRKRRKNTHKAVDSNIYFWFRIMWKINFSCKQFFSSQFVLFAFFVVKLKKKKKMNNWSTRTRFHSHKHNTH